ncbi:MAG TPA: ATP-binding protein [Candidatus Saccharimonadales bacterium]|nr:ATP-binding protein [Candidatus Saccharimonadales bacterium]
MRDRLLVEAQQVERAIARVRWGAAALAIVLGPSFPNFSVAGVYSLGVFIVAYNLATLWTSARARGVASHRRVAAAAFAGDLGALSVAMLLFSTDPLWTTFFLGTVVITAGAFRFGTVGTFSATAVVSAAYLAISVFRAASFGFPFEPERVLFHLSIFALTALLLDRSLRDARELRGEREDLIVRLERRVREDEALAAVMRIVAQVPSANAVVPAVLEASREVFRFDRATVFVADDTVGEYRVLFRLASDTGAQAVPPPRLRLGEGLIGAAIAEERALLVPNVLDDPRYLSPLPNEAPRSVILVPLQVGGRPVAVFSLSRALPDTFGADDLRLAETVAGLIAQVLENDRLFAEASEVEALRVTDRMKDEFLASVSHELRTPLTVIGGSLELLAAGRPENAERLITQARRNVDRLQYAVQELLELAELQQTRIELASEYVSCESLFSEAAGAVEVAAERRGQRIVIEVAPALPDLSVDRRRMQQVLGNLVMNAVRYGPADSTITLRAVAGDGVVRLSTIDEGAPIPTAEQDRLFDRFYRRPAHRDVQGGTGLGLAIAKTLVQLHGGTLAIRTGDPTGNEFIVELPR